jgi:RHS repeat-associated protein
MNRLVNGDASVYDNLNPADSVSNPAIAYGDQAFTYDQIGNILTQTRGDYYLSTYSSPPNHITKWYYVYQTGTNKLVSIDTLNTGAIPAVLVPVFTYSYDKNGNLLTDSRTGVDSLLYCRNNLPRNVTVAGTGFFNGMKNMYDAGDDKVYNENFVTYTGTSHRADVYSDKQYYLRDANGTTIGIFNMLTGTWEWNAYGLNQVASVSNGAQKFYTNDHLGGTRVTYSVNTTSCSAPTYTLNYVADYYPLGKILRSYVPSVLDRYGFDGSEREKNISDNNYYTPFRQLDVEVGRWWGRDPEFNPVESPYAIMAGNPVNRIDPMGLKDTVKSKDAPNNDRPYDESRCDEVNITGPTTVISDYAPMKAAAAEGTSSVYTNTEEVTTDEQYAERIAFDNALKAYRTWKDSWSGSEMGPEGFPFGGGDPALQSSNIDLIDIFAGGLASRGLASIGKAGAAETILNPNEIHFMQSSIKNTTGEFTVLGNAEALKSGALNPSVLKMNVWKDANGKIWTLDHRRLAAFRLSGLQEAPIQWANPSGQMWKMTTTNGGTSVALKLDGGVKIIIK